MQLTEKEIALLVERVTGEVKKLTDQQSDTPEKKSGTIAIMADMIPSPKKAIAHIKTEYGEDTELYLLNDVKIDNDGLISSSVETREQKQSLLQRLADADKILLISPSLGTLKRLKSGNDENFSDSLILRAILWQKSVSIVLDFDPPKFKRGTMFEAIIGAIDSLTSMNVRIDMYKVSKDKTSGKVALVTENEIIDAKNNGEKSVVCERDAIVTPLAVDKAKELKINIVR